MRPTTAMWTLPFQTNKQEKHGNPVPQIDLSPLFRTYWNDWGRVTAPKHGFLVSGEPIKPATSTLRSTDHETLMPGMSTIKIKQSNYPGIFFLDPCELRIF